jgi:hypothetical protein
MSETAALWSIYRGQASAGFVLSRGKLGYEAFNASEKSLGIFPTRGDAANAILTSTSVAAPWPLAATESQKCP